MRLSDHVEVFCHAKEQCFLTFINWRYQLYQNRSGGTLSETVINLNVFVWKSFKSMLQLKPRCFQGSIVLAKNPKIQSQSNNLANKGFKKHDQF